MCYELLFFFRLYDRDHAVVIEVTNGHLMMLLDSRAFAACESIPGFRGLMRPNWDGASDLLI